MGYGPYDPYEGYDRYGENENEGQQQGGKYYPQQPYQEQPYQEQPYQEQAYQEQPYQEQYEQQGFEQQQYAPEQQYQEYQESQYQNPQFQNPRYQDAQWAQSGLGWEQQAWDEARLGMSPLQGYENYQQPYPAQTQFEQPNEYRQPEQYEPEQYGQVGDHPQFESYAEPPPQADPLDLSSVGSRSGAGLPHQRADEDDWPAARHEPEPEPEAESDAYANDEPSSPRQIDPDAGRGAFGAAGIAVVTAVAALASSGALYIVIGLIQAAVAYGWQQAVGPRSGTRFDRRAVVVTTLVGWAATASAAKLQLDNDFVGLPGTLGVGFLLLAADQMMRRKPFGDGDRVEALGIAVTGGLFAVLPAAFAIAERVDSSLTAACAMAAAVGVLCCALLGKSPVRGIMAGLVLGAGVGAVAAKVLSANGGLEAGALGGAVAAIAAATATETLDRVIAEAETRGSTRVVAQVLPIAFAAMGALFASAVFR